MKLISTIKIFTAALLTLIFVPFHPLKAGNPPIRISLIQPLSFGNIISAREGAIEIDASAGPAKPRGKDGGGMLVTGGHSGLIRIYTSAPQNDIILSIPDPIKIKGANCSLGGIRARSSFVPRKTPSQHWIDVNLGGVLRVGRSSAETELDYPLIIDVQLK